MKCSLRGDIKRTLILILCHEYNINFIMQTDHQLVYLWKEGDIVLFAFIKQT